MISVILYCILNTGIGRYCTVYGVIFMGFNASSFHGSAAISKVYFMNIWISMDICSIMQLI